MGQRSRFGFGLLIAYVLPGFSVLAAASLVFEPLQVWLLGPSEAAPAVGGVLYVTAASILIGKLLNALRWVVLDWLHAKTGIARPEWDDRQLPGSLQAFEMLVEDHYRYYQFYGNMALALPIVLLCVRVSPDGEPVPLWAFELPLLVIESVLIACSRDALRRYFLRAQALLRKEECPMTNGSHPKADPDRKDPRADRPKAETPSTAAPKPAQSKPSE